MKREIIIKRTLIKLSRLKKEIILEDIKNLKLVYGKYKNAPYDDKDFSKEVVKLVIRLVVNEKMDVEDRILFLAEAKKK